MSRYPHSWLAAAAAAGMLFSPGVAGADDDVPLEKVPPAVKQVIDRELRGGTIDEIELETEDDTPFYEVEIRREGKVVEFKIRPDGVVVQDTTDKAESALQTAGLKLSGNLTLDQVPEPVRKTIEEHLQGGKIDEIEREEEDGIVFYEVEIERDGKDIELNIAPDGKVLPEDVRNDDAVTTPAVVTNSGTTTEPVVRQE